MTARSTLFAAFALACSLAWADPPRPPPPPSDVPDLLVVKPPVLCVGCDEPFDMSTHKGLLKDLASNPYSVQLRQALYTQDVLHQFESKAHFDNCDFDSAIAYVRTLHDEADAHVTTAMQARAAGNDAAVRVAAEKAFFALGQALHAVQDFYAHTNYVEMQVPKVTRVTDIEVVAPWRDKGRARITELRAQGLFSGFVFWGLPQNCPAGTPSHGDVAKDAASTKSGGKPIKHLQNLSQYKIAEFLAREASLLLMADAFKRWPLLKELNGTHVAVDVLVDRRGIK